MKNIKVNQIRLIGLLFIASETLVQLELALIFFLGHGKSVGCTILRVAWFERTGIFAYPFFSDANILKEPFHILSKRLKMYIFVQAGTKLLLPTG